MRAVLIGSAGPVSGREYALDTPVVSIGRRDENDIVVKDPTVSRKHAEIRQDGDDLVLRDNGSTSGTLVNGNPIAGEHRLRDGDTIAIGSNATFAVQIHPDDRATIAFSRDQLPSVPPPAPLASNDVQQAAQSYRAAGGTNFMPALPANDATDNAPPPLFDRPPATPADRAMAPSSAPEATPRAEPWAPPAQEAAPAATPWTPPPREEPPADDWRLGPPREAAPQDDRLAPPPYEATPLANSWQPPAPPRGPVEEPGPAPSFPPAYAPPNFTPPPPAGQFGPETSATAPPPPAFNAPAPTQALYSGSAAPAHGAGQPTPSAATAAPKASSRRGMVIGLVVSLILLLAVAIAVGFFAYQQFLGR